LYLRSTNKAKVDAKACEVVDVISLWKAIVDWLIHFAMKVSTKAAAMVNVLATSSSLAQM